ncbi:YhgE/Pip domain-containing protein [Pseudobutyrivibrio sp.]|uniref:YhgE/Pip domain-containing protein n=1 Tax=Pseudobutyrivibrio sp. TaxID=2014367 RepID=UPI001B6C7348|nr:YhgE/Pip domain-containing protein [Pseudobutyrivibrio sp.]MBP3262128.1 YhgE/Pip domain-containing protein [Pseudobutyrivibrio sp.]
MKNVIKIIASDIKRLSTNVVAMVVIIGLTVIPSLYAWFNILSNWDPYGESATSNLQVAVASSDQGIVIGNMELNVGDIIISRLKENTTIGWVFTDTAQEAIDGVYAGEYYAALVIDEEFSDDMISFLSGDIKNPVITYYENEKKNAIAPKITAKVKTTIEREVDHAFVSTVAEALLKGGEYFATLDEEGNITGQGIAKLERLDSDLKGVITILDSYIALMDSTENISEAGATVSETAESITKLAGNMADNAQKSANNAKQDIQKVKGKTDSKIGELNKKLDDVDSVVNDLNTKLAGIDNKDPEKVLEVVDKVNKLASAWGNKDNTGTISNAIYTSPIANELVKEKLEKADLAVNKLQEDSVLLGNYAVEDINNFNNAKAVLVSDVAQVLTETRDVRSEYENVISPFEQKAIESASNSVAEVKKLLNYNATSIDLVISSLESYSSLADQSKDSLVKSRNEAVDMERQLAALISDIKSIGDNEAYQKFVNLLQTDPDLLSDFISSPVEISDEYIYPVENNGSMTAPFYIVLSIWVGALIMSTILKTAVKDTTGMTNLKNWQCFFGRFFVTFVIGQIQTIITVMGALLFVGIQCEHPFYFWLACAWTSLIYSLLLYSFAYSFGNIGEALSVILMVIQVAGAGGTFPIEVLPKVFQVLYKFMPFNYSMNAVRECIAGFYENTYRNCMLTLIIYGIVAIFVGVVLYYPFKLLNEKIENSKEKSGILI